MAGVSGSGNNMRVLLGGAAAVAVIAVGAFFLRGAGTPDVSQTAAAPQPAPQATAVVATPEVAEVTAPSDPVAEPAETAPQPEPDPEPEIAAETETAPPPLAAPEAQSVAEAAPEPERGVADAVPAAPPQVAVVRIDPKGSALLAGTAPEGSTVSVELGEEVLASVQTTSNGEFAALFALAPSPEPRALSVVATLASGEILRAADTILVAGVAPAESAPAPVAVASAPVADAAAPEPVQTPEETPTAEIAVVTPPPPTVLRTDGETVEIVQGAPELVTSIGIDTITYDTTGDVVLSGRGDEASEVRVYLDNRPVKSTEITVEGTWRADLPDVDTGLYTLRIDEVAADGTVVSRLETPFERASPEVAAAIGSQRVAAVTVQPGFTLWGIAQAQFGDGTQYVQVFEANRALIRDPDLIYPGQVFAIPQE